MTVWLYGLAHLWTACGSGRLLSRHSSKQPVWFQSSGCSYSLKMVVAKLPIDGPCVEILLIEGWTSHLHPTQPSLLSKHSCYNGNPTKDKLWLASVIGCLRTWFQHWQDRSQRAAQQKAQLERAVQHHHQQLLRETVAHWKMYHLGCVRKRVRWQAAAPAASPVAGGIHTRRPPLGEHLSNKTHHPR